MDQTYKRKIRLLSKNSLDLNVFVTLNLQETHYLKIVMRCNIGNVIYLFNDIDMKILNMSNQNLLIFNQYS